MFRFRLLLSLLLIWVLAAGQGYALPVIFVQAKLKDSPAIAWTGRQHATIDALRISAPLSVELSDCSDITISACDLHAIQLVNCTHIIVANSYLHDALTCGVDADRCQDLLVQGNRIERVVSGLYALDSQEVKMVGNSVMNVQGPFPSGHLVQFDHVTGTDNAISYNYAVNEWGKSHPEDVISLRKSHGTAASPIWVADNYVMGDPDKGSQDMSRTGSGIMLGDNGGDYLTCYRNVVINAGQVGIAVAGGNSISVEDNLIYGAQSNVSNVGIYVWNQSGLPSGAITLKGNRVQWTNKDGEPSPWWDGGGSAPVELSGNTFGDDGLPGQLPAPPSRALNAPQPWGVPPSAVNSEVEVGWKPH